MLWQGDGGGGRTANDSKHGGRESGRGGGGGGGVWKMTLPRGKRVVWPNFLSS